MNKKIKVLYLIMVFFLMDCDNEPYEGELPQENDTCALVIEATNIAAVNFLTSSNNDYNVLCQTYKDAIENQIEVCGDEDGALGFLLDELGNCIDQNLCAEAILETEIAQSNYENTSDDNFETNCLLYKEALLYQVEVCGDDGTLTAIIEELGDCQSVYVEMIGTWKLIAWEPDPTSDINNDGMSTDNYLDEIDCYDNETIIFYADGTGRMFFRSEADILYQPIDGTDQIEFIVSCYNIEDDIFFSWVQNGNTITFTLSDGTQLYYFRNANRLFVIVDDGFYATSVLDNTSVITDRVTYVYEKL